MEQAFNSGVIACVIVRSFSDFIFVAFQLRIYITMFIVTLILVKYFCALSALSFDQVSGLLFVPRLWLAYFPSVR